MSELAARPLPLARGLELEWLGTAGYRLTYEGQTLLIDPYLTRVPLRDVLRRAPALADPALHARFLPAEHRDVVGHPRRAHPLRPCDRRAGARPLARTRRVRLALTGAR